MFAIPYPYSSELVFTLYLYYWAICLEINNPSENETNAIFIASGNNLSIISWSTKGKDGLGN